MTHQVLITGNIPLPNKSGFSADRHTAKVRMVRLNGTHKFFRYGTFGILAVLLFIGVNHARLHFIDYPVYDRAGGLVLSGNLDALYDLNWFPPFYYGYFFALIFAGLHLLGATGKYLFCFMFYAAYIKVIEFSVRKAREVLGAPKELDFAVAFFTILLSLYAVNDAFMNANVGLLLLALCVWAFDWRERHPVVSGFLIAVAVVFKLYPIAILGFFVWEKRWLVVGAAAVSFIVLYLGLPVSIYGWARGTALVHDQLVLVSRFRNFWTYDGLVFQNISASVLRYRALIFPRADSTAVFHATLIVSSVAVILLYSKSFLSRVRIGSDFVTRMFGLILALTVLVTPVSWYNMATFYVPMIAYLVLRALRDRDRFILSALGIYTVFFCLSAPDIIGRSLNDKLELYGIPFLGVMALVLAYLRDLWINHRDFIVPELKLSRNS